MPKRRDCQDQIFWGILLIAVGVFFLLDRMGQLNFGDLFGRFWPLLLIFVGLWNMAACGYRRTTSGLFLIVLGTFFMLFKLEILGRSVWHYFWPLLIIAAGLWILIRPALRSRKEHFPDSKEGDLDIFIMFSGLERRVETQEFKGGKATAVMGGIELDFSHAKLAGGKSSLKLTAILGGIDMRIPKDWKIELDGNPVLGGIEDKHRFEPGPEPASTLYIKATAILGGIEIKN